MGILKNNTMKKIFITAFMVLVSNFTKSQTTPSPNASSLGIFGQIPVSYFIGAAEINIPIYSVTESGISIPATICLRDRSVRSRKSG